MPRKRITVRVEYDQDATEPDDDIAHIVTHGRDGIRVDQKFQHRDISIHEYMRGVSVGARVDIPRSYTDQGAADGFAYITRADVRKEWGKGADAQAKAIAYLTAQAKEWRAWADGSAFYFTTEERTLCALCLAAETVPDSCPHCTVHSDSCGGFITDDPQKELADWMGDYFQDEHTREALLIALDEGWSGEYPTAGIGSVDVEN